MCTLYSFSLVQFRILVFGISVSVFISCSNSVEKVKKELRVSAAAASIDLSEITDSVKIFALRTPDSVYIADIDQVKIYENMVFVVDKDQTNSITLFDLQTGDYISQLARVGDAPGHYNNINAFCYDGKLQQIIVHSLYEGIFVYSLQDLEFLNSFPDPDYIIEIEKFGESSFFVVNDTEVGTTGELVGYQIWSENFDRSSNVGLTSYPISIASTYDNAFILDEKQNLIVAVRAQTTEIYNISEDSITKISNIDFGNKSVSNDFWSSSESKIPELWKEIEKGKLRYHVNNYLENTGHLSFWFFEDLYDMNPDRLFFLDKESGESAVYKSLRSNLLREPLIRPSYTYNQSYYHVVRGIDLSKYAHQQLRNSFENIDMEDLYVIAYSL